MIRGSVGETRDGGPEEERIMSGTGQLHGCGCRVAKDRIKTEEEINERCEVLSRGQLSGLWMMLSKFQVGR